MKKYKIINHTADIGVAVRGKTKKELFKNTAEALFDLMTILKDVDAPDERKIIAEGENIEDLLINFLREVLYLFNGKGWLMKHCRIKEITTTSLVAQLEGQYYNQRNHQIKKEIKAVTYHGLSVKKNVDGWKARVIFDV